MLNQPSQVLAAVAWASVFVEAWLLLTRHVPADGLAWGFWVFFLVIAVLASLISAGRRAP